MSNDVETGLPLSILKNLVPSIVSSTKPFNQSPPAPATSNSSSTNVEEETQVADS